MNPEPTATVLRLCKHFTFPATVTRWGCGSGRESAQFGHICEEIRTTQETAIDDPWLAVATTPDDCAPTGLQIETIEHVVPLDAQIGVFPKKAVPDALWDALFGQPAPSPVEIETAGGDPAAVPPMRTYAILDAAKVTNLPEVLEDSELEYRCLFKGKAYDDLKNVAPWIVRLEDGNIFTRNLFTSSDAYWHLWDNEPGIYMRSRATFDDMWRHFRKFTRFQDEDGKWLYFRFWEPRTMQGYLDEIHKERKCIVSWFGGKSLTLSIITISAVGAHSSALSKGIIVNQNADPIKIDGLIISRVDARQKMEKFSAEEGISFDWSACEPYDYEYKYFDLEDLKIIVLLHGRFGIVNRYPIKGMYSSDSDREARKHSILMRMLFFKKQGILYGV